jgi:hypothetical protein
MADRHPGGVDVAHVLRAASTPARVLHEEKPTTRLPLPLRNALAELAIAALDDDGAAAALAWIADPSAVPSPATAARLAAVHLVDADAPALLGVHAPHAAVAAAHAARALAARTRFADDEATPRDPVARAVHRAVALWNECLFFEVHEVLEAVWTTAAGDVRQALQGLIQVAVAFHHLAHGNVRGARSLLGEGRARLAGVPPTTLPDVDVAALLDATAPWVERLANVDAPAADPPPLATRRDG